MNRRRQPTERNSRECNGFIFLVNCEVEGTSEVLNGENGRLVGGLLRTGTEMQRSG